ncbi:MAG: hypothetical protein K2W85_10810 [Phycisphaerales bacterium]|nr:hypothetical protein [Phycisphaerales bacterium]
MSAECRPVDEDSGVTVAMPDFKASRIIFDNMVITGVGCDKLGRVVDLMPFGSQNLEKLPQGKEHWYRSILIARNGRVLSAERSNRPPGAGECAFRITHEDRGGITISSRDAADRSHGYMMPSRRKSGILLECACDRASP